jgi:hypothetical protein
MDVSPIHCLHFPQFYRFPQFHRPFFGSQMFKSFPGPNKFTYQVRAKVLLSSTFIWVKTTLKFKSGSHLNLMTTLHQKTPWNCLQIFKYKWSIITFTMTFLVAHGGKVLGILCLETQTNKTHMNFLSVANSSSLMGIFLQVMLDSKMLFYEIHMYEIILYSWYVQRITDWIDTLCISCCNV